MQLATLFPIGNGNNNAGAWFYADNLAELMAFTANTPSHGARTTPPKITLPPNHQDNVTDWQSRRSPSRSVAPG